MAGTALALHMATLASVSGIPYGSPSLPGVITVRRASSKPRALLCAASNKNSKPEKGKED